MAATGRLANKQFSTESQKLSTVKTFNVFVHLRGRQRALPSIDSLPKCPLPLGLGQISARGLPPHVPSPGWHRDDAARGRTPLLGAAQPHHCLRQSCPQQQAQHDVDLLSRLSGFNKRTDVIHSGSVGEELEESEVLLHTEKPQPDASFLFNTATPEGHKAPR